MSYVTVDVDLDDVLSSLGKYERKAMFESLQSEGYISKLCVITQGGTVEATRDIENAKLIESEDVFNAALQKLFNNGWRLSNDDIECIINISCKIIK